MQAYYADQLAQHGCMAEDARPGPSSSDKQPHKPSGRAGPQGRSSQQGLPQPFYIVPSQKYEYAHPEVRGGRVGIDSDCRIACACGLAAVDGSNECNGVQGGECSSIRWRACAVCHEPMATYTLSCVSRLHADLVLAAVCRALATHPPLSSRYGTSTWAATLTACSVHALRQQLQMV